MKVLSLILRLSVLVPVSMQVNAHIENSNHNGMKNKKHEWVNVKRSQYGMAHIEAGSLYGLAYGNAYAQAQDHSCILADGYLRVQGKRAEFLGPDIESGDSRHVLSDFGYRILDIRGRTARAYASLSPDTKALAEGFAAGYNEFLNAVKQGKETLGSECHNAAWVRPIEAVDVVAGILDLGVQNSSVRLIPSYVKAHPLDGMAWLPKPVVNTAVTMWDIPHTPVDFDAEVQTQGSNGWALGKQKTANGRGMILANPHFPFNGNFRFWATHAKVKGEINAMGASIIGFPGPVNVGFNQNVAWTHTYSAAVHAVVYRLSLKPGDRLSYELDGQWQPITSRDVQINVKTEAGITQLSKTIFHTDVGIIIEDERRFPWDDQYVYVIKDANLDSFDAIDHWLAMNRASNMQEFKRTFSDFDGLMFNNTLVADSEGDTFYVDDSNVPLLSSDALNFLKTNPMSARIFADTGIVVLPGTKGDFIFRDEIAFVDAPQLQRDDFVQNSNDSYWLTNDNQPLSENSPLYGEFEAMQTLRTRHSLDMLQARAGADNKFTMKEVENALFDNTTFFASFQAELNLLCSRFSSENAHELKAKQVAIDEVCHAVSTWDGKFNRQSKAAHLINEFVFLLDFENDFKVVFDAANPSTTPRELIANADMLNRLLVAGDIVKSAGYALTAKWGDIQYLQRGEHRISWPGPTHNVGGFNIYAPGNRMDITSFAKQEKDGVMNPILEEPTWSGLNQEGVEVHFGSSWMMVVGFDANGPKARGLLTYSQSTNSHSKHFADQSRFYSKKQKLVDLPYTEQALAKQLQSNMRLKVKKD